MKITLGLKKLYKTTIPYLWGYEFFCNILKIVFSRVNVNLVTRLPVKPGIIVDANLSIGILKLSKPERCSIAKKLYWTDGNIIPEEDNFALESFIRLVKKSHIVLDIGANSGIFALSSALANPKAKIYTFDILPESIDILEKNIEINGLSNSINSNLIGVGAKSFFYAPKGSISSEMPTSLKLDSNHNNLDTKKVEIKTLDDIYDDFNLSGQASIKIDVEGFEGDIFKNASNVIKNYRPFILCEVLTSTNNYSEYCDFLSKNHYIKYLVTENSIRSLDKIVPHKKYKDWFFIPKEKSKEVSSMMT